VDPPLTNVTFWAIPPAGENTKANMANEAPAKKV
jgi:hypothetical protein